MSKISYILVKNQQPQRKFGYLVHRAVKNWAHLFLISYKNEKIKNFVNKVVLQNQHYEVKIIFRKTKMIFDLETSAQDLTMPNFNSLATIFRHKISKFPLRMLTYLQKSHFIWILMLESGKPNRTPILIVYAF